MTPATTEGQRDRREFIITDNSVETIKIVSDGERFFILRYDKTSDESDIIILNSREAQEIARFIVEEKESKDESRL